MLLTGFTKDFKLHQDNIYQLITRESYLSDQVLLRDISAEIYEKLGFLLNPASIKNWIYLAGKLNYTYAQASNYKLHPMQSTQMLLEDWATRADATVLKLYQALKEIGREDAARELEPFLAASTPV